VKKSCFIKTRHKLDTICYQGLMKNLNTSLTQVQSIDNYNFKILRSEIWPMMT